MSKTQATPAASVGVASQAEVEDAVGRLSNADALRLAKVGDTFARKLVAVGLGINGEDLLREAIKRTGQVSFLV